jgi:hypothetical protein
MTAGLTIFIPSAARKRVTQRFQAIGEAIVRNDEVVGSIAWKSYVLKRAHIRSQIPLPQRSRLRLCESDEGRLCLICHLVTDYRRSQTKGRWFKSTKLEL